MRPALAGSGVMRSCLVIQSGRACEAACAQSARSGDGDDGGGRSDRVRCERRLIARLRNFGADGGHAAMAAAIPVGLVK